MRRCIHIIRRFLARHRRNPLVLKFGRVLGSLHAGFENLDYDLQTNGERFVAKTIGAQTSHGIVFDVGANLGDWSAMASSCFPDGKIHAFEVIPSTYQQLLRRCASHPNVIPHPLGLSDRDGVQDFFYSEHRSDLASGVEGVHGATLNTSKMAVDVTRGDLFCERAGVGGIDFLKIDVEGLEPNVLNGFSRMLLSRQIKVIQFEYNIVNIRTKFLLRDFYQLLEGHGMTLGKIFPNHVEFRGYTYEHEDFRGPNYLAVQTGEQKLIMALAGN
jgi:FkbM family methyltransferase